MTVGPATRAYHTTDPLEGSVMDGTSLSPGTPGPATLQMLETHLTRTRAAAYTVSRLVEEAFDSPHPSPAARRYDGIALLLDSVTYTGLTMGVVDLLKHVTATADTLDTFKAGGEQ